MNSLQLQATESEIPLIVNQLFSFAETRKVFLFKGDLGSGKTTLIKSICQKLGVKNGLSSPSFSILNEYQTSEGKIIYHFDLYRLKSVEECFGIGLTEYLDSGNYCLLEWPEIAESLFPDEAVLIEIDNQTSLRTYRFSCFS